MLGKVVLFSGHYALGPGALPPSLPMVNALTAAAPSIVLSIVDSDIPMFRIPHLQ